MNWKIGDKFWVDYRKLEREGATMHFWKEWFPEDKQPFTIEEVQGIYIHSGGLEIRERFIYHDKNHFVNEIINDL